MGNGKRKFLGMDLRVKEEHIMNINMCLGCGGIGKMTKNIFYIWEERVETLKGEGFACVINRVVWVLMGILFLLDENM